MMYRTYAASLMAAIAMARGLSDGSSKENAYQVTLINDSKIESILYTWNEKNVEDEVDTFRGELEWKVQANQTYGSNAEFGFCV